MCLKTNEIPFNSRFGRERKMDCVCFYKCLLLNWFKRKTKRFRCELANNKSCMIVYFTVNLNQKETLGITIFN